MISYNFKLEIMFYLKRCMVVRYMVCLYMVVRCMVSCVWVSPMYGIPVYVSEPCPIPEVSSSKDGTYLSKHKHKKYSEHHKVEKKVPSAK